jgi:lauroyl-KDO2-lipid IV(A) myristoyltransferase
MSKPFISKNNSFGESEVNGEIFEYKYLHPRYWLTWLFLGLSFLIAYSPTFLRAILGELLGKILFTFAKSKKDIVEINLKLTFYALSAEDRVKLSRLFFRNLGHMYINLPLLWWKSDRALQKIIDKKGLNLIDSYLQKDQSIILFVPHTLSLDFGGRALSKYDLLSMYKPFKNNLINWFIGRSRSKDTDKVVIYPRNKIHMKTIIKNMKKPSVFYLLADEDISMEDSLFSNFFDTQKTVLKSVSKLAKITKSKVLPCICTYDIKKHKYCFQVFPELENFPSDNLQDDCAKINSVLERQIMINKTQYMWTLRIYKNRPDGSDIYKIY